MLFLYKHIVGHLYDYILIDGKPGAEQLKHFLYDIKKKAFSDFPS